MMKFMASAVATIALLSGCATIESDSPYNSGVEAWKKKDYQEAADQWSRAVLAGNPDAMNNLGYLYFYGQGIKPRKVDAIGLWHTAALAGQSESQTHLAWVFEQGDGVEQDLVRAYAWYYCSMVNAGARKAADASGTEARMEDASAQSLDRLEGQLSADELSRAKILGEDYARRYAGPPP
jgi:hypothetical protein